jgi:hypothetical protein
VPDVEVAAAAGVRDGAPAVVVDNQPDLPAAASQPACDPAGEGTARAADVAWVPVFDPADDLHGLLKARGRLLSRAFNGAPTDRR